MRNRQKVRSRRTTVAVVTGFAFIFASRHVSAQDAAPGDGADTTSVTAAPADSVEIVRPIRFRSKRTSNRLDATLSDSIPAHHYAYELVDLLNDEAGSFLYDFSDYGWPHGWSPRGLAMHNVGITWNGIEVHDLFTGRARYEVVPVGAAEPPVLSLGTAARAINVAMATRPYERLQQPLTELRYQSGGGLQKVTALHTQTRRLGGGAGGLLNLLFWYRGQGSSGEYPGTRLRRGRQVMGRLIYARPGWSVELSEVNTRHPLAAHGGVLPRVPSDFNSVYQRLGAQVVDEDARRQTLRNDIAARWTRSASSGHDTSFLIGRTDESLEYRRPGDTLKVASARNFGTLRQRLRIGANELAIEATGAVTTADGRSDTLGFGSVTDRQLRLGVSEFYSGDALEARASVGLDARSEGTVLTSAAAFDASLGPVAVNAQAVSRPESGTIAELVGLGHFLTVGSQRAPGRVNLLDGKITLDARIVDISFLASISSSSSWRDFFGTENPDSIVVRRGAGKLNVVAAGLDFGFRRHAPRGFYLTAKPTLFGVTAKTTSDLNRYDDSLPDFYAVGRLGARYLIFRGDLDLDISVRGRFWSQFLSRSLHAATGVLALRSAGDRPIESSAALDVVVEAGVRTATLFLAYENFLSGTSALPGNMLVPVYPLAERRLRFGVFWPIGN